MMQGHTETGLAPSICSAVGVMRCVVLLLVMLDEQLGGGEPRPTPIHVARGRSYVRSLALAPRKRAAYNCGGTHFLDLDRGRMILKSDSSVAV
jgi:hypothetical protein